MGETRGRQASMGGWICPGEKTMVASTGEGMGNRAGPFPKLLPVSMASSGGLPGDSDCDSDVEPAPEPVEHGKDRTPGDAKMQLLHLHQV